MRSTLGGETDALCADSVSNDALRRTRLRPVERAHDPLNVWDYERLAEEALD